MAFPLVESITQTIFDSNTTAHLVAMPATVAVDDLLASFFTNDGSATVTTPTGWTLKSSTENGTASRHSVYVKKAAGTEGGTTVDHVTSTTEQATAQVYRILAANWSKTLSEVEVGTAATGTSTAPDPPSLTPAGGAKDYLWIASLGNDSNAGTTGYPTNYTNGTNTVAGTTAGACTATARRELNASVEDPGTFTIAASRPWTAQTLVVPPASADPTLITASDTVSVGVTDTQASLLSSSVTDTPSVAVTDTQASLLFSTVTDNPTVFLSETQQSLLLSDVADTLGITVTEAAVIAAILAVSDTLTVSVAEAAELLISEAIAVSDTLSVGITETVDLLGFLAVAETITVGLAESQQSLLFSAVADTLTVGLSETQNSFLSSGVADAVTLSVVESAILLAVLAVADTLNITLTEAAVLIESVAVFDPFIAAGVYGRTGVEGSFGRIGADGSFGRVTVTGRFSL